MVPFSFLLVLADMMNFALMLTPDMAQRFPNQLEFVRTVDDING